MFVLEFPSHFLYSELPSLFLLYNTSFFLFVIVHLFHFFYCFVQNKKRKQYEKRVVVVHKKPLGRRKRHGETVKPGQKWFQQTVRCYLGEVRAAAKLLKEPHRAKVRQGGFGCVFDWVLEGNVSRVLMCHLLMTIDTSTMTINCGPGRTIVVNREVVHHIFWVSHGR